MISTSELVNEIKRAHCHIRAHGPTLSLFEKGYPYLYAEISFGDHPDPQELSLDEKVAIGYLYPSLKNIGGFHIQPAFIVKQMKDLRRQFPPTLEPYALTLTIRKRRTGEEAKYSNNAILDPYINPDLKEKIKRGFLVAENLHLILDETETNNDWVLALVV